MNNFPPNHLTVIEAAIFEFQEKGFNGTSMESIAKEAGIDITSYTYQNE